MEISRRVQKEKIAFAPMRTENVRMPYRRSPRISGTSFNNAMTMPNTVKKADANISNGGSEVAAAACK